MANLIDLVDYKDSKGIQGTKDDVRLNILITSVSQLVKTYCGTSIIDNYSSPKFESLNIPWDSHILQLSEGPVLSISTISERPSYSSAYSVLTTSKHEYYLDEATDSIFRTDGTNGYKNWAKGPGAVQVTYFAGYPACPEDLKLAVFDLVTYYFKDEHKARQTLQGASVQNTSTSSQRDNVAFPDHIKRVLDLYKNF